MNLSIILPSIATIGVLGFGDPARAELSLPVESAAALHHASPAMLSSAAVTDTVTLDIKGMTCGGCTLATRTVLERLDGVTKADVSYEKKNAVVTFDSAKVTVVEMIEAVATLKYTATVAKP